LKNERKNEHKKIKNIYILFVGKITITKCYRKAPCFSNGDIRRQLSIIKLERLANIRSTTRTSRKNSQVVEYVNLAYTSQTCPVCGHVHHANDRNYTCKCGFHIHRDLLGAMNTCNSTEYVGDSNIRHTA